MKRSVVSSHLSRGEPSWRLKPEALQELLAGPGASAYLLEQSGPGHRDLDLARQGYAMAGERQFGTGRKIRLWKRP